MRALSLTQPWATLVAIGAKRIETRTWPTTYRGPVVIHAAKGFPRWARGTALEEPFASALRDRPLPLGAAVAVAFVDQCFRFNVEHEVNMPEPERSFGDFTEGRFGFRLEHVVELPAPIECKGALGLWTVTPATAAEIVGALRNLQRRAELPAALKPLIL